MQNSLFSALTHIPTYPEYYPITTNPVKIRFDNQINIK